MLVQLIFLFTTSICCFALSLKVAEKVVDRYQPEQVHLSYGENPTTEMVVMWTTQNDTKEFGTVVEYGEGKLHGSWHSERGIQTLFTDQGPEKRMLYIHKVKLVGLKPGAQYFYHCGSKLGWSDLFFFRTMLAGTDWSPRLVIYGDLGHENAQSLPRIQQEAQMGLYDAVIHVGDFAYDFNSDNARVGDEFMRQIQPISAYLPYMTCPGNHEQEHNFTNYKARFKMPGTEDNMMYSFRMGPVHFIAISTEYYYFTNYGFKQIVRQYYWLEKVLKEASLPENRAKWPWLVIFGHRPMYCSNDDHDDCTHKETLVRAGIPVLKWFGLEKLLYRYGVDLAIWAHEHSYERLWPVFDRKVFNGSSVEGQPYRNPRATVHITTGSAGCNEGTDKFIKHLPDWSAFRISDYGYSRMVVHNKTHLQMEQVSDDQGGKVVDSFWIIKDKHTSFGNVEETW